MKAARVLNGELGIHDVDAPTPGVDQALIRITASGVCHSDLHLARGDWYGLQPPSLGHEAIGIVEDARPRRRPLREGRRSRDPRPRRERRWLLVRRVRVLPPRPASPLRADAERHRHVRRAVLPCARRSLVILPDSIADDRGAARLRRPHRVRRGEEAAEARRAARTAGRRHRRGRRPRPLRRAARDRRSDTGWSGSTSARNASTSCGRSAPSWRSTPTSAVEVVQRELGGVDAASCSRPGSPASTSVCSSCARPACSSASAYRPRARATSSSTCSDVLDRADAHLLRGRHRAGHARARSISLPRAGPRRTSSAPARSPTSPAIFDELEDRQVPRTGGDHRPRPLVRQRVPEEDLARIVENGLAASSQGRMRPPWPYNTKETQHDDPADGQRPHRCRRP